MFEQAVDSKLLLLAGKLFSIADIAERFYPELCTSNTEKGNFIFNIGLLYFTNVFKSFTQKVKLIFDIFFRHLKPQGVADFTESALLSGA